MTDSATGLDTLALASISYNEMASGNVERSDDENSIAFEADINRAMAAAYMSKEDESIVIDSKYKPSYSVYVNHQDIRQVSGYSRLRRIRERAKVSPNKMLDCVIIYPDLRAGVDTISDLRVYGIKEYEKVWKVGVNLPVIQPILKGFWI